jgi:hypothetical protein
MIQRAANEEDAGKYLYNQRRQMRLLWIWSQRQSADLARLSKKVLIIVTFLEAQTETFQGPSGISDFIVMCMRKRSRNRTFGETIKKGKTAYDIGEPKNVPLM